MKLIITINTWPLPGPFNQAGGEISKMKVQGEGGVLSEAGPKASQALIKLGSPFQVGALPGPGPPPLLCGRLTNCSRGWGGQQRQSWGRCQKEEPHTRWH